MAVRHNAIVLGSGLIGATIARDLAGDATFAVTAADIDESNLRRFEGDARITPLQTDLGDADRLRQAIAPFDIVLGALPSALGFQALTCVVEAGKPYVDISFMPEDALSVDAAAKENGVTAVVDCGVSPGLSNLLVGRIAAEFDEVYDAVIYVGGLPFERRRPFEYKAPFAPSDVIEEYVRPARMVEAGRIVTKPALSEPEPVDFAGIGTLEAFNTDGLRTLLRTVRIPNLREKTLRYPGHCDLMRAFREAGFFSKDEIQVRKVRVIPLHVTAALLFPQWELRPDEEEFTVLRVTAEGTRGGRRVRQTYDLFDRFDPNTMTTSMARTTASPAAIVARAIMSGSLTAPGVFAPEALADLPGMFDFIMDELRNRGIKITCRTDEMT